MAHIAMLVPAWIGHLNPMTTLGRELKRRGHRVTVVSLLDSAARVARADLEFAEIGTNTFPLGDWDRRTAELAVMSGLRAAKYTIRWTGEMTATWFVELHPLLVRHDFDGIVVDQTCFGAELLAEAAQVPVVIASNALPISFQPDLPVHSQTWPPPTHPLALLRNRLTQTLLLTLARPFTRPIRDAYRRSGRPWNVRRHLTQLPPSLAHVAQLPACLDFPRRSAPDHFHHTGPWHESSTSTDAGFDWNWLDRRPLIYASLGTLQNRPVHLYQTILDATSELPFQIVLTLGREDGPRPERVPANAKVLGYGPQLALLKRASMVITHAGLNTVLEALTQGLPMVALPIANEQPGIAARIHHVGVGDFLATQRLSASRLRATIKRVHADPSFRQHAVRCAEELVAADGLRRAATIIELAFAENRRVTRKSVRTST